MSNYLKVYRDLQERLNKGEKAAVVTRLSNQSRAEYILADKFISSGEEGPADEKLQTSVRNALVDGTLQFTREGGKDCFLVEPYFPRPRLIVFGGGHVARPVAEFGAKTGFEVTVFDDRPSFANTTRFPMAEKVICGSFDNATKLIHLNKASFVVIVTRGHRYDLECLKQALQYDCAYIGMMGSRRRVKGIREQLVKEGYSREKVDGVCAPVGLDIGAETPEEIGVAIVAQLIRYRRNKYISAGTRAVWPEYDQSILESLGKDPDGLRAMVTIVDTKGSVPREAGAKMLVWMDGRTLGSIGGGCGESEAVTAARDVIKTGVARMLAIDMTGDTAEEEGMVCGGIMDVIIEPC